MIKLDCTSGYPCYLSSAQVRGNSKLCPSTCCIIVPLVLKVCLSQQIFVQRNLTCNALEPCTIGTSFWAYTHVLVLVLSEFI